MRQFKANIQIQLNPWKFIQFCADTASLNEKSTIAIVFVAFGVKTYDVIDEHYSRGQGGGEWPNILGNFYVALRLQPRNIPFLQSPSFTVSCIPVV